MRRLFDVSSRLLAQTLPYARRLIHKKTRSHPSRRMKAGLLPIGSAWSLPAECRRLGDGGSDRNGYRYASGTQDYRKLPLDCARGRPWEWAVSTVASKHRTTTTTLMRWRMATPPESG